MSGAWKGVIGPDGPRRIEGGAEPGDIYVAYGYGPVPYVGRVMRPISFGEMNSWGRKIMPLNPQDWKPEDIAMAHPIEPEDDAA